MRAPTASATTASTPPHPNRKHEQPKKSGGMKSVRRPTSPFPLSEGIGIFVGVMAWDLLFDGQAEFLKALLISVPSTFVWFAIRCWKDKSKHRKP
jgi:hypothetical protein